MRRLAVLAAALAAFAVAACGSDDEEETVTTTVTAAATDDQAEAAEEGATTADDTTSLAEPGAEGESSDYEETGSAAAATTDEEPVAGADGAALGVAETSIAERPMRIEITELVRQGKLATLNFSVTNLTNKESEVFYHAFDDTGNGTATDGLLLIDPKTGREHRVIRNPGKGCLCSDELPFTLAGRQTINLSATFDAPPASTSEVNVSFPEGAGQITGVPIEG